jgi:hypothetical protein
MGEQRKAVILVMVFFGVFFFLSSASAANGCGDTNHVCTFDANINADMNWIDGNTYVVVGDVNVTGAGVDLNIQPGAVVKYWGSVRLHVFNGARLIANGTPDKNIIFTSCRDQNTYAGSTNVNTSTMTNCSGAPAGGDYNNAISLAPDALVSGDANNFSYLKIFDANAGLFSRVDLNSIHDINVMFIKGGGTTVSSGFRLETATTLSTQVYRNTFEYVTLLNAIGFRVSAASGGVNVFNNTFKRFTSSTAIGMYITSYSGSIYSNSFDLLVGGTGIDHRPGTFTGGILDNNLTNFSSSSFGIWLLPPSASQGGLIARNTLDTFSNSSGIIISPSGGTTTGAITDNVFKNFTAVSNAFNTTTTGTVSKTIYNNVFHNFTDSNGFRQGIPWNSEFYNNTFSNFNRGTVFYSFTTVTGSKIQRNVFANVNTAYRDINSGATVSNNAFYNVITVGAANGHTVNDQNSETGFSTDPFVADGSDRNFLLNTTSTGGAKLVDAGGTTADGNYNLRTTQFSNKLDRNFLDIGVHYDQNAPYVQVLSPSDSNTLAGNQSIDFNVESAYGTAAALTARLAYATTAQTSTSGGTQIVSQALSSYSCSAGPVFRCSYAWNTDPITDGNYFIVLTGTDSNGSRVDNSDNNFALANDSTAPATTADYNNAWQNTDANVGLSCTDTSGCALTQYRVDSDSTSSVSMGAWTTYTGAGISITSDGNWAIDYNSTDTHNNRESTHRIYVLVDKSLPTLSLTITNVTVSGLGASFSYSGSATSGIKKYWISTDGGTVYIDNGTSTDYSFSIGSNVQLPATVRVYIKAQNNADINTAAQAIDIKFESASGSTTKLCGNNVCDASEHASTCPLDCESICGDKACTHIENPNTCPIDCAIGCGNQTCESTESSATCPVDCGYTYDDENPNTPPIDIVPEIDPNTGTPKQCSKNADCEDNNLCTANRCIKNICYAVYYPDGEPCDVGSVCQNHACIRITKPFTPPTQTDPVFIVSVVVILLVLGTIAFEYFKK